MLKLVTFSGYDNRFGPHIFPIEPDVARTIGHIKMARPLPAQIEHYIKTAQPIPGKTQLLIDAMGSGEYYGSNVNGDYFPEEALSHAGPEYGFETFMHYAYPFKNHVNKDPARAYGDKVTLSAYDPVMHRVLLIVRIDDSKCSDILGDLANGRYWDVSMGCRVPWDECSICRNRARNRGEYCTDLRYQMNRILGDGRRVFAYNRLPRFFDISFVPIGAEKASHVLKKVASGMVYEVQLGSAELAELHYAKVAAAQKSASNKVADISKQVPAQETKIEGVTPTDQAKVNSFVSDAGKVKAQEPEIPTSTLDQLAGFPLSQVFATLAAMGIDLRPQEFQRIVLVKQGMRATADKLAAARLVFDEYRPASAPPPWAHEFSRLTEDHVNEKVAMLLAPYLADRSCYPELLASRLARMEKRADVAGYDRNSQWYPMTDEQKRKSSGMNGLIPASMALATGFMVFRRAFPQLIEKAPSPIRAIAKRPWLLPLLASAGVGAMVDIQQMRAPHQMGGDQHGTGAGLDAKNGDAYHQRKTAGINPLVQIGLIPLAYIHAGVQEKRAQHGEPFPGFDRIVAADPDQVRNFHPLSKHGGVMRTPSLEESIVDAVHRLARMKESHAHAR